MNNIGVFYISIDSSPINTMEFESSNRCTNDNRDFASLKYFCYIKVLLTKYHLE